MIAADDGFDGPFPYAPHFSEAPGFRIAVPPALMIADFTVLWPDGPVVKLANAGH